MARQKIRTGRAGEHFAAYLIESTGLEASRVDGACDLHVTLLSGRILRVEVKSATKPRGPSFRFLRGKSEADVYALIAMSDQPLLRLQPANLGFTRNKTITVRVSEFTQEKQDQDLSWLLSLT